MNLRESCGNWRNHVWAWYLGVTGAWMFVYLFVPPLKGSGPLINAIGFSGAIALVVGIRLHKPKAKAAWWPFTRCSWRGCSCWCGAETRAPIARP